MPLRGGVVQRLAVELPDILVTLVPNLLNQFWIAGIDCSCKLTDATACGEPSAFTQHNNLLIQWESV